MKHEKDTISIQEAEEIVRGKLKEHGLKLDDSFDLAISKTALLLKDELEGYSPSALVYWMAMYAINHKGYMEFIDNLTSQLRKLT